MHEHHHHRQLCTCKYHTQLFRWRFYIVFLHHTLRISLISPLSTEKRPTLNPVFAENYMLNLRLTFTQWQRRGWRQRSNHGKSSEKKSSEATKNESWLIKGMKCAPHTDSSIKTHDTAEPMSLRETKKSESTNLHAWKSTGGIHTAAAASRVERARNESKAAWNCSN